MRDSFIPVNQPHISAEDVAEVINSLEGGWVSGESPVVEEFETSFANLCGRKYGLAVCNGTVAIDLAFEAVGITKGDEVIVPSFTIISCISYLLRIGATPIFVDSDPATWNMDVNQIESKISEKTKAIIVPHIYGLPAEMDKILQIASEKNIFVIEDAAEAHGLKFKNQICGSFGDISTFSFYSNKNITTGEGGMILTNSKEIAEKIKNLRNLNFRHNDRFINDYLGYNYRMSAMQAALGKSQIKRLDSIIQRRIEIAEYYNEKFKELDNVQLPTKTTTYSENHYWVYGIKLTGKKSGKAKHIQKILLENGIGTRPFFQVLHKQPVLVKYKLETQSVLPVAEDLSNSGFYIPNGLGITSIQLEKVAEVVNRVLGQ